MSRNSRRGRLPSSVTPGSTSDDVSAKPRAERRPKHRRTFIKLLITAPALPAAAIAAAQSPETPPKPSPVASCIAANDPSLSADDRARLEKAVGTLEQSLKVIRDFELPPNTDPAMRFHALKSRGRA